MKMKLYPSEREEEVFNVVNLDEEEHSFMKILSHDVFGTLAVSTLQMRYNEKVVNNTSSRNVLTANMLISLYSKVLESISKAYDPDELARMERSNPIVGKTKKVIILDPLISSIFQEILSNVDKRTKDIEEVKNNKPEKYSNLWFVQNKLSSLRKKLADSSPHQYTKEEIMKATGEGE